MAIVFSSKSKVLKYNNDKILYNYYNIGFGTGVYFEPINSGKKYKLV
jgi:hypothetical protein